MRALSIAALALLALAVPASAQGWGPGPVCLMVYGPVNSNDCSYATIEQCRPLASGRSAQCITNPYYKGPEPRERSSRRR